MVGFPDACDYNADIAIPSPIFEDTVFATSADQFAWTCGWYVTYEWGGADDVFFVIYSANSVYL